MKKFLFLLLLLPVLGITQTKTILTSNRLVAKNDKAGEFEKALSSHAQKYHKGDVAWRVWSIESGPDAGGYMVTEGPSTWSALDSRADISAEHTADWEKNVLPLTEGRGQSGYYDFQADLSTVQLTDYSDKIVINHMTAKPGMINKTMELIQKLKKVWVADKESVAVYSVAFSGEPGYITVTRLKNGLKELASDYRKPMTDRFNAANGAGSFDAWLKDYADAVQMRWSELLIYKPLLSSK
ncbi:MAG: hypothetical protein M3Y85_08815, partial [Bacteroidota bacterium]|nr:hypothetical protein [Bacteroidota bacterium]